MTEVYDYSVVGYSVMERPAIKPVFVLPRFEEEVNLERAYPDRTLWARESLAKTSARTLSADFAQRANVLLGQLSDEYPITSLAARWNRKVAWKIEKGFYVEPSDDWCDFMESLNPQERIHFCNLIDRNILRNHTRTVGDMREISSSKGYRFALGSTTGKPFAYLAFKRIEPQETAS